MQIVWLIKSIKAKKVSLIYFSKFVPWKFLCLVWSLLYRFKLVKIINGKKIKNNKNSEKLNFDIAVVFGTYKDVCWFKTHCKYQNLIIIENIPGLLLSSSGIVEIKDSLIFDPKFIPYCVYSNFHHKLVELSIYKKHFLCAIGLALNVLNKNDDKYLQILAACLIENLFEITNKLETWDNFCNKKMRNPKTAIFLEQVDNIYQNILNNLLANDSKHIVSKYFQYSRSMEEFEEYLILDGKKLLNSLDEIISKNEKIIQTFSNDKIAEIKEKLLKFYVF